MIPTASSSPKACRTLMFERRHFASDGHHLRHRPQTSFCKCQSYLEFECLYIYLFIYLLYICIILILSILVYLFYFILHILYLLIFIKIH